MRSLGASFSATDLASFPEEVTQFSRTVVPTGTELSHPR